MHIKKYVIVFLTVCFIASTAMAQDTGDTEKDSTSTKKNENLPLEVGRMISFPTDEGSWISLDVSPDGSTIVFDLLGDLYTLPLTGGEATRLTSSMAFDSQPRYSPDGKKVLFVSDRSGGNNLWTIDLETGDSTQVTKGNGGQYQSPEWTPDGEYIVASKGETRLGVVKLWMGHVDGGAGQILIPEPANSKTVGPALSPDGRYIWHAQRTGSWQYNASMPQYQLAVYDRETGDTFTRTSRYGSAFRPTLSPDGKWLVYGTRHEEQTGLRIRALETGEEEWLAFPVQRDDQESIADLDVLPGMSFTPDSEELVASYGGKIYRIPVDGSDAIPVPFSIDVNLSVGPEVSFDYRISDDPTFIVKQIRDAVPSPDGSRLAFTSLDRLYVMDYPDGTPRRLTDADYVEAMPTWSPDGEWVAYVTWSEEGGNLMKVRADGGQEAQMLSSQMATYWQPAWSPDGSRIVVLRGTARAWREATGPFAAGARDDILWFDATNPGDANFITPSEGRAYPHFAGSSDRIYLSHGSRGLVSIRWDGTDEKEHLKVVGHKRPGASQPNNASITLLSPTGKEALAQVSSDIYAVSVPLLGGKTPTLSVANPANAPFPAKKLTDIGGEFPFWSGDGRNIHWSVGNAHVVYDLDRAEVVADSLEAATDTQTGAEEEAEEAGDDNEGEKKEEGYKPAEHRILIEATRDIPDGIAVLRGARVITMEGDQVIENADILIRNNRIEAVGENGSLTIPSGAHEVDLSGKTVVPGFVDTHAHMWPAWNIHKTQEWTYLANLAYGVTTTRDPQTSSSDVITYGDLVEAGKMMGPRIYSTGPGVFGDYVTDPIRDQEHANDILKRYSEYYDTKTIKMYMSGNRQQRQWIIKASRDQGLMPTTEGGLRFKYNITMLIDGYPGQEHSYPVFPLYKDMIQLTAQTRMVYTPTLLVAYGGPWAENYFFAEENPHDDPKLQRFTPHADLDNRTRRRNAGWFREEEHVFTDHAVGVKDIVEAGGLVGVGSHGQLQGLGFHWELWAMHSGGMTNHDALRAATIMGAEAIGVEMDLGSVTVGKIADLVVLDANPLENIRHTNTVHLVIKNGRIYDGDTLDEVWPRQRSAQLPYQDDPPADIRAGLKP